LFAYHEYPADDQEELISPLPLSAQLSAISSALKQLPTGAGNTEMSLRQILRILRIANSDETSLRNTIRRTLMVDCLPNHMKSPINQVLGSVSSPQSSSVDPNSFEISHTQSQIR
jgi:hypothetical protein